ncbi:MAG: hypothetical protein LBT19_02420 [Candidatus Nomurabacteria bacterium]|jgi:hypothetical protein|nr:hypothetical protein [Candidatus Nomurabacteria bacterium]
MNNDKTNINPSMEANDIPEQSSPWQSAPEITPAPETKPKKKKIALIVTICVLAVLLIGGSVFAAIYTAWRQSDTVVIMDAVTSTMKKSKIAVTGTMDIEFNKTSQDASGLKAIHITLGAANDGADTRGDGTFTIVTPDSKETTIVIGGAFVSDGTIYFRIDGIRDALETLDLPDEAEAVLGYIDNLIDDIDGEWYKIQIADLNLDQENEEKYTCMVDAINYAASKDSKNELAELYTAYPFLIPNKQHDTDSDGNVVYGIKWDANDLASFTNNLRTTELYKTIGSCDLVDDEDATIVTPDDVSDVSMPDDFPELNLHIDLWSHELRGFSTDYSKDGNSLKAEFHFAYDKNVNVEIPQEAKSINDLVSSIETTLKNLVTSLLEDQISEYCSSYTGTVHDQCTETYSKQIQDYLKEMDFSDYLSLATGSQV